MNTLDEPLANASDMFAVHTMFRREFGLMPRLVRTVEIDDMQRAEIVADHVALVSAILGIHHDGEDHYIWPLLRERGTAKATSIVLAMQHQHEAIHENLAKVTDALASWRDTASAEPRDSLAAAIDALVPMLDEHLTAEERDAVPLIEKYLTAREYGLTVQEGANVVHPDKMATVFGMMMYEAGPSVIDRVIAEMPPDLRLVIRDLAIAAYAEYAKELYGTATPPRLLLA